MIGAALQRLGIALVLVGGVDEITKAAAWEIVEPNGMVTAGLGLVVIGLVVTVVEKLSQGSGTDAEAEHGGEAQSDSDPAEGGIAALDADLRR